MSTILSFIGEGLASSALDVVNSVLLLFIGLSAWIFERSAEVLAAAIGWALAPLSASAVVIAGWTIFRDIANVFFIFILLVIAIATILRLESYGIKRLLPTLIIVALLINFSLLTTQYIILPSNWLAGDVLSSIVKNGEFVNQVEGIFNLQTVVDTSSVTGIAGSSSYLKYAVGLAIAGLFFPATSLPAAASLLGLAGYSLFNSFFGAGVDDAFKTQTNVFVMEVGIITLNIVAAFTLLAGALMVTIRTVYLLILMIVSPLAFLAHAVPGAQGYARQWWSALLKQSLFLPIYLLFIYLAIEMAKIAQEAIETKEQVKNLLENPELLYFYVMSVVFLIASLMFAKQMGAYGASLAIRYGQKGYRAAGGYAGRLTWRGATAPAAAVAERLKESRITRGLMQVSPRLGAATAAALEKTAGAAGRKEKAAKLAEQVSQRLSPLEQARAASQMDLRNRRALFAKTSAQDLAIMRQRAAVGSRERQVMEEGVADLRTTNVRKWAQVWSQPQFTHAERHANWIATTDNEQRQELVNATSAQTIQSLAQQFGNNPAAGALANNAEREAFVQAVHDLNPDRIADVLAVLPAQFAVAGMREDEAARRANIQDMTEAYARENRANLQLVAQHMSVSQHKDAALRGGEVEQAIIGQLRTLTTSTGAVVSNIDELADALDSAARAVPGATPTTTSRAGEWIRRNQREARRVYGLP